MNRPGRVGLAALLAGGGASMALLSCGGLIFAPATHAASLFTAVMPIRVAILCAIGSNRLRTGGLLRDALAFGSAQFVRA